MEISIERSPQHWCPSAGFELTTVGPEFDTLDRSATDPPVTSVTRPTATFLKSRAVIYLCITAKTHAKHFARVPIDSREIYIIFQIIIQFLFSSTKQH